MRRRLYLAVPVLLGFILFASPPGEALGDEDRLATLTPGPMTHLLCLPLIQKPPPISYGRWDVTAVTEGYPDKGQTSTFWTESGSSRIGAGAEPKTYYRCKSGIFVCYGTTTWRITSPVPIDDEGNFRFNGKFNVLSDFTWEGRFGSSTSASGTFNAKTWTTYCGFCSNRGTWTARYAGTDVAVLAPTGQAAENHLILQAASHRE